MKTLFEKDFLIMGCGQNSIRFCAALTVEAAEIDMCLLIVEECLKEIAR
jgi:4-aminobutyrate aminotransferase